MRPRPYPLRESLGERPPSPILYLARYAPAQGSPTWSEATPGHYPRYHAEIYHLLQSLGLDAIASDDPSTLVRDHPGSFKYVFSLFNRIKMHNSEVFISALCEYLKIPYLGAGPQIRGVAEDKKLGKLLARSLGISTPDFRAYSSGATPERSPPFPGPFFVKPRFGAGSEGLSKASYQESWDGAVDQVRHLGESGVEALVEQYITGRNVTVPVLGGALPHVFPPVESLADNRRQILTHRLKLQEGTGMRFQLAREDVPSSALHDAALRMHGAIAPIDYFRMDYRVEAETNTAYFLEMNICCDISSRGSVMFSARSLGYTHEEILTHVLSYSFDRQEKLRVHLKGVL